MKARKLYGKLCDEYINKNIQNLCSLQTFLQFKYDNEKNIVRKNLILDVINIAANDYPY